MTQQGNFEGTNILNVGRDLDTAAGAAHVDEQRMLSAVERGRRKLFEARTKRVRPGRDEKVLTAWNGLMLAAFAEAGRVLGRSDYMELAERNARFVLSELRYDGRLMRSWTSGGGARHNAYLEDYACYAAGLLALYQATFDVRWFLEARTLSRRGTGPFRGCAGGLL